MESPSKQQGTESLYELPSCTICLQELVQDLSSLDCGHVFHLPCISQHFEYRGSCPNCQKRAALKEVRTIHFRFIKKYRDQAKLASILASLPHSEKKQAEALMQELRSATEQNEKMKLQVASLESEVKSKNKTVDSLREEIYKHKDERDKLLRENRRLNETYKSLSAELQDHVRAERHLRSEAERLRKEEREFDQMKLFKRLLAENSQEIVKYKAEHEARGTPPEQIAKDFYDMLLMKNLDMLRAKEKLKEFPQRLAEKDNELAQQKSTIDGLQRELKELGEKRTGERRKHEELREKYRALGRQKGVKEEELVDENSQGFSNRSVHLPDDPVIQSALRKPFFGHGHSTIGGFSFKKTTK